MTPPPTFSVREAALYRSDPEVGQPPPGGRAAGPIWALCGLYAFLASAACGPLETERSEARPPFLDPESARPAQRVVSVGSADSEQQLSVTPFDPNREDSLNSIWTSESEVLDEGELLRRGTTEINGETFYEYETARVVIDACDVADGGDQETVWLHVADRGFGTRSPAGEVAVNPGGFLVTRSWVLTVEPATCS